MKEGETTVGGWRDAVKGRDVVVKNRRRGAMLEGGTNERGAVGSVHNSDLSQGSHKSRFSLIAGPGTSVASQS